MEKSLIVTADGSHSVSIPGKNLTYHSVHGAVQESMHVFIEAGLLYFIETYKHTVPIRIWEMGFGTGLNALLTLANADNRKLDIHFTSIELLPLTEDIFSQLNYCDNETYKNYADTFQIMHKCEWGIDCILSGHFTLHKINGSLLELNPKELLRNQVSPSPIDLIYYDAFAPSTQPELWTSQIFEKLFYIMAERAVFVTYCSKGDVKRTLLAAGFKVEKIPGPKGKREMLRALKE